MDLPSTFVPSVAGLGQPPTVPREGVLCVGAWGVRHHFQAAGAPVSGLALQELARVGAGLQGRCVCGDLLTCPREEGASSDGGQRPSWDF